MLELFRFTYNLDLWKVSIFCDFQSWWHIPERCLRISCWYEQFVLFYPVGTSFFKLFSCHYHCYPFSWNLVSVIHLWRQWFQFRPPILGRPSWELDLHLEVHKWYNFLHSCLRCCMLSLCSFYSLQSLLEWHSSWWLEHFMNPTPSSSFLRSVANIGRLVSFCTQHFEIKKS